MLGTARGPVRFNLSSEAKGDVSHRSRGGETFRRFFSRQ